MSFEIAGAVQSYEWGALGPKSKVAHYAKGLPDFQYDEKKPYAELWMGTHLTLPSRVVSDNQALSDYIHKNPHLLGENVRKYYQSDDLPFLFKVLAVGKALSIQAHPDKELGKKLHKDRPDVYKDPNHKPEMAIALTDFSGFCGFRPLKEIVDFLSTVPEFKAVVGSSQAEAFTKAVSAVSSDSTLSRNAYSFKSGKASEEVAKLQEALRELFAALMNAKTEEAVVPQVRALVSRFQKETGKKEAKDLQMGTMEELVLRLNEQFPDDVGIFCSFLLNVVALKPGQAVFLEANEPHAYLSEIMECMATSDNVVRAGLTPKLRDVPTLVSMLTYTWGPASTQLMQPSKYAPHTTLYDPPIEEFSVLLTDLLQGGEEKLPAVDGPSIFIVTQLDGEGTLQVGEESFKLVREGQTFFVGAGKEISVKGKLVSYTAFVEAPRKAKA